MPFRRVFAADLPAVTAGGRSITLTAAEVGDLAKSIRGEVMAPDAPGYEAARHVWNAMFDRHPALIVRPRDAGEVVKAVQFARTHDLLLAVRSGGHSASGQSTCDGGMVIDMTAMKEVGVDPKAKIARVQSGVLLGALDHATAEHGLATTAGVVSHTGVAGLTLGGGMGRLHRKYGLTIDNLREVEIVLADGRIVTANAEENADLFWGVRGGGGNFGVVTRFDYRLHDFAPMVPSFSFAYAGDDARTVLKNYLELSNEMPAESYLSSGLIRLPNNATLVTVGGILYGSGAQNDKVLQKLRGLGKATREKVETVAYTALQSQSDELLRHGKYYYAKAGFTFEDKGAMIDDVVRYFNERPLAGTHMLLLAMGGAVAKVTPDGTAYPHRKALQNIDVGGDTANPAEKDAYVAWGRDYWKLVEPYTRGGYVNSLADVTERNIVENWGANYARLVEVKTKYDPTNLFRLNANVKPRTA